MAFLISCAECGLDAVGELTTSEVIMWVNAHECEDEDNKDDNEEDEDE